LFYSRTKSVTQHISVIERLLRAAQHVIGDRIRLSEEWLWTTGLYKVDDEMDADFAHLT